VITKDARNTPANTANPLSRLTQALFAAIQRLSGADKNLVFQGMVDFSEPNNIPTTVVSIIIRIVDQKLNVASSKGL
jgi:hypothetical protein